MNPRAQQIDRDIAGLAQLLAERERKVTTLARELAELEAEIDRPLRLSELLVADEFNFAHDILGIRNCLNRETGELENCFVPRYAL